MFRTGFSWGVPCGVGLLKHLLAAGFSSQFNFRGNNPFKYHRSFSHFQVDVRLNVWQGIVNL